MIKEKLKNFLTGMKGSYFKVQKNKTKLKSSVIIRSEVTRKGSHFLDVFSVVGGQRCKSSFFFLEIKAIYIKENSLKLDMIVAVRESKFKSLVFKAGEESCQVDLGIFAHSSSPLIAHKYCYSHLLFRPVPFPCILGWVPRISTTIRITVSKHIIPCPIFLFHQNLVNFNDMIKS